MGVTLCKTLMRYNTIQLDTYSSHIDMHTHDSSTLHNLVTLTFDLFTSRSMHAKVLPYVYQVRY